MRVRPQDLRKRKQEPKKTPRLRKPMPKSVMVDCDDKPKKPSKLRLRDKVRSVNT